MLLRLRTTAPILHGQIGEQLSLAHSRLIDRAAGTAERRGRPHSIWRVSMEAPVDRLLPRLMGRGGYGWLWGRNSRQLSACSANPLPPLSSASQVCHHLALRDPSDSATGPRHPRRAARGGSWNTHASKGRLERKEGAFQRADATQALMRLLDGQV
jgi:hypothetical protein